MEQATTDYAIFKRHPKNRDLIPDNLKKIENSILFKNMLHLRPILVDADMRVIDGQHRLAIAKKFNIPVYYRIEAGCTDSDIILLNANQKNWNGADYFKYYCNSGNENYIKLNEFIKDHDIKNISCALELFGFRGSSTVAKFRAGAFKMPQDLQTINERLLFIKEIMNILDRALFSKRTFYRGNRFMRALLILGNTDNFDYSILLKKIQSKTDSIFPMATTDGYITMLKNVYNWRNNNPI